jgi:hypothetical protein
VTLVLLDLTVQMVLTDYGATGIQGIKGELVLLDLTVQMVLTD